MQYSWLATSNKGIVRFLWHNVIWQLNSKGKNFLNSKFRHCKFIKQTSTEVPFECFWQQAADVKYIISFWRDFTLWTSYVSLFTVSLSGLLLGQMLILGLWSMCQKIRVWDSRENAVLLVYILKVRAHELMMLHSETVLQLWWHYWVSCSQPYGVK